MLKYFAISAIAIYLLCSLLYLDRPGLYYDETFFVNVALGNEDGSFIDLEVPIGRYRIPVMLMPYIGALKSYFYFPIFKLFGTSPATVRLPPIFLAFLTFALIYFVVRNSLSSKIAWATILLFATDPTFIYTNKLDLGPIAFMMLFKMLSLHLLFHWLKTQKSAYLYWAALVIGLAIFDKVVFLWYVAAVTISFLLFFWPQFRTTLNWKKLVVCFVLIFPFLVPSIVSNVRSSWNIFNQRKVLNTSIVQTFEHRRVLFNDTMNGTAVYEWINFDFFRSNPSTIESTPSEKSVEKLDQLLRRFPLQYTLMAFATLLTVFLVPLFAILGWFANPRHVLFYFSLMVLITVFIYITDMATGPHHVLMLYPFPHILIASLIFAGKPKKHFLISFIRTICLIVLVIANLAVDARYITSFAIKGGAGAWSDAIYRLAEYAESQKNKTFLLMDWGFSNPLLVLNRKRIIKEEAAFDFKNIPTEEEKLSAFKPYFDTPNALFVFFVPKYESQPSLSYFKQAAEKMGHEYKLSKSIEQGDGTPVYLIYEMASMNSTESMNSSCTKFEAEDVSSKSGGNVFQLDFTSNGNALADYWGANVSDFASYHFTLPNDIPQARIYLRYAYQDPVTQNYYVYLDEKLVDVLILQSSGGFGHTPAEWKVAESTIGFVSKGNHHLTIKPSKDGNVINLDYFVIGCRQDVCSPECGRDVRAPI
jgi:4-amino-4-deoxy-L-arabinose transferase-like glycosyltransferase